MDSLAQDSLAQANEPQTIWEDMPFVRIHQPRYIQLLAEGKYIRVTPGKEVRRKTVSANPLGYRLEIYQSNDQRVGQGEANRIRATLTGKVTVPIYVRFYTPFWRVRIGDFRTLEEANAYKRTFLQRFPVWLVRPMWCVTTSRPSLCNVRKSKRRARDGFTAI